jgi:hypothetical protein
MVRKFIFVLLFFLVSCSTNQNIQTAETQLDTTTSSSSTTTSTTSSTTSTTVLEIQMEEAFAVDLVEGDCFNVYGLEGAYINNKATVYIVPCDSIHQYEILTTIKYQATEESEYNFEDIPNLEIYTECENSYYEKFGRDIGGTSTYISWIGNFFNFEEEQEFKCFGMVFNTIEGPQELSTNYQTYLSEITKNFVTKKFNELEEGECFWKRRPDAELLYKTEVDAVPCTEVHSHEVLRIYDLPNDNSILTETEFYIWSFNVCHEFGSVLRPLAYLEDNLDGYEIRTVGLFDEVAYQLGEQDKLICYSNLHSEDSPSDERQKNISISNLFNYWIGSNDRTFEDGSIVRVSCPSIDEMQYDAYVSTFIFSIAIEYRPIKSITFTYIENGVEYQIDFTDRYRIHGFDDLSVTLSLYDSWYLYMISDRSYEEIMELNEGNIYPESAILKVVDANDESYISNCEV